MAANTNTPEQFAKAISSAMDAESARVWGLIPRPIAENPCAVESCAKPAYAKGYCWAHYTRQLRGKPMDKPLRHRMANGGDCINCQAKIKNNRSGWSMCDQCFRVRRRAIIRTACIEIMGGKCTRCHNQYPNCAYDFHHVSEDSKDFEIAELVNGGRVKILAEEVAKCILLCANCHRITHNENSRFSKSKGEQ